MARIFNRHNFWLGFSTEAEAQAEADKRRGKKHDVTVERKSEGDETWWEIMDRTAQAKRLGLK